MDSTAGPSKPKRQKGNNVTSSGLNDTDIEEFLLEDDIRDFDFELDDEDESSSDDDFTFEPSICFHGTLIHETQSPAQDLLATDQPSISGSTAPWETTGEMVTLDFTKKNEFHGPHAGDPIDYFNFFFDEEFLKHICNQTNEQAVKLLLSDKTTVDSRITRWKELTVGELKIFLGLIFHMGTIQMSRIQDYWKKSRLFAVPVFAQQMSRNRFLIIMRCLHFTSETYSEDPLHKIRSVVDYFNKKMADCYYPARQLTLDESMVLWRGRLVFRQEIKNNRQKYGIKVFMLTEPDGLVLKLTVYAGRKDVEVTGKDHAEKIAIHLLSELVGNGHEVYMNEYYNSVALAKNLLDNKTYCTGPLRSNLKSNPREVMQKKLKHGENISRFREGVHVGRWRDRRGLTYVTTEFADRLVPVTNKRGQGKEKPEAVAKYDFMSAIDRQDQLLSFYPCERHAFRWYLKIAIHTFQLLLINSYKIYNKYSGRQKMTLYDFRLAVIDKLLPEKPPDIARTPRNKNWVHTISRIAEKAPTGRVRRKQCRQCWKRKQRTDTRWHCVACDDKPGLCVECFDLFHTQL